MIIQYSGVAIDTNKKVVRYSRKQLDDVALRGLTEKIRNRDHRLNESPMVWVNSEYAVPVAVFAPGWRGIDKDTETEAQPRRRWPEENDE